MKRNSILVDDKPTSVEEINNLLSEKGSSNIPANDRSLDQRASSSEFSTPQAAPQKIRGPGRPPGSTKKKKDGMKSNLENFIEMRSSKSLSTLNDFIRPKSSRKLDLLQKE